MNTLLITVQLLMVTTELILPISLLITIQSAGGERQSNDAFPASQQTRPALAPLRRRHWSDASTLLFANYGHDDNDLAGSNERDGKFLGQRQLRETVIGRKRAAAATPYQSFLPHSSLIQPSLCDLCNKFPWIPIIAAPFSAAGQHLPIAHQHSAYAKSLTDFSEPASSHSLSNSLSAAASVNVPYVLDIGNRNNIDSGNQIKYNLNNWPPTSDKFTNKVQTSISSATSRPVATTPKQMDSGRDTIHSLKYFPVSAAGRFPGQQSVAGRSDNTSGKQRTSYNNLQSNGNDLKAARLPSKNDVYVSKSTPVSQYLWWVEYPMQIVQTPPIIDVSSISQADDETGKSATTSTISIAVQTTSAPLNNSEFWSRTDNSSAIIIGEKRRPSGFPFSASHGNSSSELLSSTINDVKNDNFKPTNILNFPTLANDRYYNTSSTQDFAKSANELQEAEADISDEYSSAVGNNTYSLSEYLRPPGFQSEYFVWGETDVDNNYRKSNNINNNEVPAKQMKKQIQIIIPYTNSNNNNNNNNNKNSNSNNNNNKNSGNNNNNNHNHNNSNSNNNNNMTLQTSTPSGDNLKGNNWKSVFSLSDILKSDSATKNRLPTTSSAPSVDLNKLIRLQKVIDNWTVERFSNHKRGTGIKNETEFVKNEVDFGMKIPSSKITSKTAADEEVVIRKQHRYPPLSSSNVIPSTANTKVSATDSIKWSTVTEVVTENNEIRTTTTSRNQSDDASVIAGSSTAASQSNNNNNGPSDKPWEKLQLTISPLTKEKVYIVTPISEPIL